MNILWNSDEPLSQNDIATTHPELNKNTIQAVLKKLLEADFIKIENIGYSGTVLTRQYAPKVDQADYLSESISKDAAYRIAARFIEKEAGIDEIDKLETLIERKKKKLKA